MQAFACMTLLVVSYGMNAQEPIRRVAGFEPARVLKTFERVPSLGGGQTEVLGNKELTRERLTQIPDFNTSRVQHNLDAEFTNRMIRLSKEEMYQPKQKINVNNNVVRPLVEKIIRPNNNERKFVPAIEQYSAEQSEGNFEIKNLIAGDNPNPSEPVGSRPKPNANQTPKPDISWKAFDAPGDASGDVNLGVSETHVVFTTHTSVGFYDRAGNMQGNLMWVGSFFDWVKAPTGVDAFFDARCLFDPYRKRFWIGVLGYCSGDPAGKGKANQKAHIFCCAVSKTQNPMDGWYTYYWYSGYGQNHGHDYPALGINQDVFIETNTGVEDDGLGKYYANVCIFDANSLASGQFKAGWRFWGLKDPANNIDADFHIQPVIHHGNSPFVYLVGKQGNDVIVYGIKNPLQPTQSISSWVLDFSSSPFNYTTAAPQKGSDRKIWFENLSNFIFSATYQNSNLYLIMTDAKDWQGGGDMLTSLRLIRIRNDGNNYWYDINRVFGGNNKFDDAPTDKIYYGFPAIAVNAQGDMVAGYSRSGISIYPEIRASVWRHDGQDILSSRRVKVGEAPYRFDALNGPDWPTLPWADCSGAVADPSDDRSVWIASCYATKEAQNNWGVWVARLKIW